MTHIYSFACSCVLLLAASTALQFPEAPTCTADGKMLRCSWKSRNSDGEPVHLMYYTFKPESVKEWRRMPKPVRAKGIAVGRVKYWGAQVAELCYSVNDTFSDVFRIDLHRFLKLQSISRIHVENRGSNYVVLGWYAPSYDDLIRSIVYRITYRAKGHPKHEIKTGLRFAQLSNLNPDTEYTISIDSRATNGTDEIGIWSNKVTTKTTTLSENDVLIPPELHEIHMRWVQDTEVVLSVIPYTIIPAVYRITYNTSETTTKTLFSTEWVLHVTDLTPNTVYKFDVAMHLKPVENDAIIWSNTVTITIKTRLEPRDELSAWDDDE